MTRGLVAIVLSVSLLVWAFVPRAGCCEHCGESALAAAPSSSVGASSEGPGGLAERAERGATRSCCNSASESAGVRSASPDHQGDPLGGDQAPPSDDGGCKCPLACGGSVRPTISTPHSIGVVLIESAWPEASAPASEQVAAAAHTADLLRPPRA
ncbi:MAG: hypothetical protein KDA05_03725 [Phycisphaerales bacterium]|nr:hypothetical protein [Phycisphaerales bacterium]